jgi:putative ABC transport system permease protein
LGIGLGVAAVVLLTSIGEGTRQYIEGQFTQFGTNLLSIKPGKIKTVGIPGALGGTTHKLSLEDAEALKQVQGIDRIVPLVAGNARVSVEDRGRSVSIFGVTADMPAHWKMSVRQGVFLPQEKFQVRRPVAVLGPKLKRELFQDTNPLGRFVRVAGYRYRVIGVMEPKGNLLGFDIDDAIYVPVASALSMFNMDELMEIQVRFTHGSSLQRVVEDIGQVLRERHRGEEDFTIITQQAMLDTLDSVMEVVTVTVGAIAGISLIVGAIGILTVMWMSVRERTPEIGLLKATGATAREIYGLFLCESAILATLGGGVGLGVGLVVVEILPSLVPGIPMVPHKGYVIGALIVSGVSGIAAGILPARRAARIDPVEALHAK